MNGFIVEKDFVVDGYRCVIVGQKLGHRCGYIGVPKEHKYYGVDYDDIDIDIHGGWTYASGNNEYPVKSDDLWWIGFDCGHYNDGKDFELIKALATPEEYAHFVTMEKMFPTGGEVRTVEYVEQELRNAVKQLKELEKERVIEVEYDGCYPATCMGTLIIKENGKEIYNKGYCCYSTGRVWFDGDWSAHVECGELIWKDANKFDEEIQKAVKEKLSEFNVCCGGCI